ncbi:hypothetical protein RCL_jg16151.t1 [Rhizophagus clarus]|uniref:Uncharacterized protein n=1 Tax=Rhizophagus clarus TaxID=94130 RepID=A0A8H3LA83_9GLOM|nr:hypothetical protein RCL_jg16151.t1 [Rhizophagus clarus]
MLTLDSAFTISSNKRLKKEINTGYTNAIEELKILLENTCKECQRHNNTSLQDISDNSSDDDSNDAIEWLDATLLLSNNHDDRVDRRKLKKQLLLSYEWSLLKQIVNLLEPFEDATTYFILKFKYAENDDNNDDDSEIEQDAPNFRHEESDEESELSDSDEDNLKLNTLEQSTSHHYQT